VVQGHPELLELADAEAADPQQLLERLAQADQALPGQAGRLEAFFALGESQLAPEHFLSVLGSWTRGAAATLPDGVRLLFWLVCALEEVDRWQFIVEANWADLWTRLGRSNAPPALDEALTLLVARALVQVEQERAEAPARFRVHPGVAEAARQVAGAEFQAAVDTELGAYWYQVCQQALVAEGGEATDVVVRAGRSAAPYMLRQKDWATSSMLLELVLLRDHSLATVQAVLPLLRQIAQATEGTDHELLTASILARTLAEVRADGAEAQVRRLIDLAVAREEFGVASGMVKALVNLLRQSGRFAEALGLVELGERYTRRGGFGRWTQLVDRGQRLQILLEMGHNEEVLEKVQALRAEMSVLPEEKEQDERVTPSQIRESIVQIGAVAAKNLDRWETALELNKEVASSIIARGASDLEMAQTRYNDVGPLLGLRRFDDARTIMLACRKVYEAEGYVLGLGRVFNSLAALEIRLGHAGDAVGFAQAALRYVYVEVNPESVATSHHNLANYMLDASSDLVTALAHRLAAAIIFYQIGSGWQSRVLSRLGNDLQDFGEHALVPQSFDALCARVEQLEGVRFADLFARLPGPAASGDEALAEVLRLARELPAEPPSGQGPLEQWESVIVAVVAAAHGDTEAATALESLLSELDKTSDWAALAGVLRRVVAGERGESLLDGLDEVDTRLVAEVLGRLQG
jgi:hypothetical protein